MPKGSALAAYINQSAFSISSLSWLDETPGELLLYFWTLLTTPGHDGPQSCCLAGLMALLDDQIVSTVVVAGPFVLTRQFCCTRLLSRCPAVFFKLGKNDFVFCQIALLRDPSDILTSHH